MSKDNRAIFASAFRAGEGMEKHRTPEEINFGRRRRLPVLRGVEAAECGLACLTMISRYWGHNVDLNGLRQRYSISLSGANLRSIMGIADELGFHTRALRAELSAIRKVKTPAILHWDLDHFVVLSRIRGNKVEIHDPARGKEVHSLEEFSKHFTGIVLEISPAASFKPVVAQTPAKLTSLWSRMRGFWSALGQIIAVSIPLQILVFVAPLQLQLVVDEVILRQDRDLLTVLALAFGAIALMRVAVEWLRSWTLQAFTQLLTFQMVGNLFHHLIRLPSSFFEKRHVGDILSRIGSTRPIQQALTQGVASTLIDGVMAIALAVILFIYSPVLAMIVLLFLTASLLTTLGFYPFIYARSEEQIVTSADEQSYLIETVRAAPTVKIMGGEAQRESHWRNLFANTINAGFSVSKYEMASTALRNGLAGLQLVLILYLAARMIMAGDGFSVGMLFAFMSYRQTMTDRVMALVAQLVQFRLLKLHLERLGDIVQAEPEYSHDETTYPVNPEGRIALRDVSFRYGTGDRWVLKELNLEIEPGDFIAIIGPTGCGKSTFLKLALGLYPPTEGQIELERSHATPAMWRAWRAQTGVVMQNDQLLAGTIADNISFFDPDMDMSRVRAAALSAQVHQEIAAMPMQYLSRVGDMGSALSAGQRQRVLLARALYRNPRALFLDEGTANLDEATETMIAEVVSQMSITRVIIAHRPALVLRADRVYTMQDGSLVHVPLDELRQAAARNAAAPGAPATPARERA